jgi:hypothetical protein
LYGVETWTLQKVDEKYLESFEVCCWIRMVEISWTMCVTSESKKCTLKQGRLTVFVTYYEGTAF